MNAVRPLIDYIESKHTIKLEIRKETAVYADEFIRLSKATDMLSIGLFPNFKEVTESFGCYDAIRRRLRNQVDLGDPNVLLVSVGDGSTPRTAATFAMRSSWNCFSVDPNMGPRFIGNQEERLKLSGGKPVGIERLTVLNRKIEDCLGCFPIVDQAVIVACHSHAPLDAAVSLIRAKQISVVALPCCVPQELDVPPDEIFANWGIWSQKKIVHLWRDVVSKRAHAKLMEQEKTDKERKIWNLFGWWLPRK